MRCSVGLIMVAASLFLGEDFIILGFTTVHENGLCGGSRGILEGRGFSPAATALAHQFVGMTGSSGERFSGELPWAFGAPDGMIVDLLTPACRADPWVGLAGASPGPTSRTGDFQESIHGPVAHPRQ